jgi:hypothetical protein
MEGEMREVQAGDLARLPMKSPWRFISVEHDEGDAWSRPISTVTSFGFDGFGETSSYGST